jgi:hypothetical protein
MDEEMERRIEEATRRFAAEFYVLKDHYAGPDYPYTAPGPLIGAPWKKMAASGSGQAFSDCDMVSLSPLIKTCRKRS